MNQPNQTPDPTVETLRGLACCLLVAYHVVGVDPNSGMRLETGWLRLVNDAMSYLRMPLFTFLSGIVYGLRPFDGDSKGFLLGKLRRLLIPMLVVGTAFAILRAVTPGANGQPPDWTLLHIVPVAHYWFVESLLWVFLWVWALEKQRLLATPLSFGAVAAGSIMFYFTDVGGWWFSIDGALYLLPYFLVGLAVTRFKLTGWLSRSRVWSINLAVVALAAVHLLPAPPVPDVRSALALSASVALCCLCLASQVRVDWLMRIGSLSFAIYLFHVFFTAAVRIGLERLSVTSDAVHLVMGIVAGLLGPMLVAHVASRSRWSALLLLGMSRSSQSERPPLISAQRPAGRYAGRIRLAWPSPAQIEDGSSVNLDFFIASPGPVRGVQKRP